MLIINDVFIESKRGLEFQLIYTGQYEQSIEINNLLYNLHLLVSFIMRSFYLLIQLLSNAIELLQCVYAIQISDNCTGQHFPILAKQWTG